MHILQANLKLLRGSHLAGLEVLNMLHLQYSTILYHVQNKCRGTRKSVSMTEICSMICYKHSDLDFPIKYVRREIFFTLWVLTSDLGN